MVGDGVGATGMVSAAEAEPSEAKAGEDGPVTGGVSEHAIRRQARLTKYLFGCKPNYAELASVAGEGSEDFAVRCAGILGEATGSRIAAVSIGPTESDKIEL